MFYLLPQEITEIEHLSVLCLGTRWMYELSKRSVNRLIKTDSLPNHINPNPEFDSITCIITDRLMA